MKIIATNDNLDLIKTYDLGTRASMGPDHDAFNFDITTKSDLYYMEHSEYTKLLRMRATSEVKRCAARKRANARRRLIVEVER